jgi:hypothetical protein
MEEMEENRLTEFERLARNDRPPPLVVEFWQFLRQNKKWWLLPIVLVLLLLGVLIFLSGTGAAPFIYTLY